MNPDGKNPFLQALDFYEFDAVNIRLNKVTDAHRLADHYKEIAPLYHVTPDDAPTLLLHGDADRLVPIQQSKLIAAKFEEVGIPHRLFQQAIRRPSAPAYYVKTGSHWRPTSFREYADLVKRSARSLLALGVEPKGSTCILGFNRPEWAIMDLASDQLEGLHKGGSKRICLFYRFFSRRLHLIPTFFGLLYIYISLSLGLCKPVHLSLFFLICPRKTEEV